jgi:hypothetical protein
LPEDMREDAAPDDSTSPANTTPVDRTEFAYPPELDNAPTALAEPLGRLTDQVQRIARLLARIHR